MVSASRGLLLGPLRFGIVGGLVVLGVMCATGHPRLAQSPDKSKETAKGHAVEVGQKLFDSMCAGCHSLDGRGGERGPDIAQRQRVAQLSDDETLAVLRKGIPASGMPPFNSLGENKLKSLLAYLRKLQGREGVEVLPGDPLRGKALFFGKPRCAECHTMQGQGGFLGRDLSGYGAALTTAEIRAKVAGPADESNRANRMAVVTLRDSRQFSGIIRNEDNFSVQLQSLDGSFHFLVRAEIKRVEFRKEQIMPTDYGTSLTPSELNDLVSYLMQAARKTPEHKLVHPGEEEE